jgi:DNA polymerase-4
LIIIVKELFDRLYDRRMLIRMLGIRFTNLIPGNYQINLFQDTQEMIRLYQAIDSVKRRFGEGMVVRGGGM